MSNTVQEFLAELSNAVLTVNPNLNIPNATSTNVDPLFNGIISDYLGGAVANSANTAAAVTNLNAAIQAMFQGANPPTTLAQFISNLQTASGAQTPASPATLTALTNELIADLGLTGLDGATLAASGLGSTELLDSSFAEFLSNYPTLQFNSSTSSTPTTIESFISDWRTFMTTTAVINTPVSGSIFSGLPSYESIYNQIFPSASATAFQATLSSFISLETNLNGYFIPSQSFTQFTKLLSDLQVSAGGVSSIDGTHSEKVRIMVNVFKLLALMISTIQNSAVSQANLLNFQTKWQQSYTETANNVPTFTSDDGSFLSTQPQTLRQEINAKMQAYAQNLRDFNSLVGDQAKQTQSNINQSNEAVNQQSNLATSILQEFSTILQSIFH